MQAFDPPPQEVDDLTAAEAQAALNAMRAGGLQHPLFDCNHPQHADFVAYNTQLHTIIAKAKADEQDAAEAQELEAAFEATAGLTPEQCLAKASALTMTDGFINHTMAPEERAKLAQEISTLYRAGTHTPDPDAEQVEDEQ